MKKEIPKFLQIWSGAETDSPHFSRYFHTYIFSLLFIFSFFVEASFSLFSFFFFNKNLNLPRYIADSSGHVAQSHLDISTYFYY